MTTDGYLLTKNNEFGERGMIGMTFNELIDEAKQNGFVTVNDGVNIWDIDTFAEANADDPRDFSLNYSGTVKLYDEKGYEKSTAVFRLEK